MARQIDTNGTPTQSAWINTLIAGGKWTDSVDDGVVTLRYATMSGTAGDPFSGWAGGKVWSAAEVAALEAAFAAWENVCNIRFVRADNSANADLLYWLGSDLQMGGDGTLGWHYLPGGGQTGPLEGAFNYQGDGWTSSGLAPGGYGFITLVHELGHGLGLAHPHADSRGEEAFPGVTAAQGDLGTYDLNQGIFTVMSYNDGWSELLSSSKDYGWQATPMALDIAAIQKLYGANMAYRSGDDVYTLPSTNAAGTGVPPLKWSTHWDMTIPLFGGPEDGWKAREAGRHCFEASAG